jgi:hypothetical protein
MISNMIPHQLEAFQVLYTAIIPSLPVQTVFYLDGNASRGESFMAAVLCAELQSEGRIPVLSGTTALMVTIYE